MSDVRENLARILELIATAAATSGRAVDDVQLVAVSKKQPPEKLREVLEAGQLVFGESRVQEAQAKIPDLPARARWHFIGHLQKNKVRQALALFEIFHAIDSYELARAVNHGATEAGLFPRVLLQVNVAGESSKFGFAPSALREQFEPLLALDRLQICGLMTIPPLTPEPEDSRRFFSALRKLRDDLQAEFAVSLPDLSMGMSNDFAVAIEEGATMVRIGTSIFGNR